jgi:hypothetical protein
MSKKYYAEFKTWAEGAITIPWPWAKFEELPDYRLKSDPIVTASTSKVHGIFLSMDEKAATKFLMDYVAALVVGVILELNDPSTIQETLKKVFGHCEILGFCEVTDENQQHILSVMENARNKTGVTLPL